MMSSFEWKFPRSSQLIEHFKNKSLYTMIFFMVVQLINPYAYFDASTTLYVIAALLSPVIHLLYFIKYRMNSKYPDNDENTELCRIVYLKTALDCLAVLWMTYSYNGMLAMIAFQYSVPNLDLQPVHGLAV